jgi:hypothetical protein
MSMWRASLLSAVTESTIAYLNHVGKCKKEVCARHIRQDELPVDQSSCVRRIIMHVYGKKSVKGTLTGGNGAAECA